MTKFVYLQVIKEIIQLQLKVYDIIEERRAKTTKDFVVSRRMAQKNIVKKFTKISIDRFLTMIFDAYNKITIESIQKAFKETGH